MLTIKRAEEVSWQEREEEVREIDEGGKGTFVLRGELCAWRKLRTEIVEE